MELPLYVSLDVAAVHFLCAVPLALVLARLANGSLPRPLSLLFAAFIFILAIIAHATDGGGLLYTRIGVRSAAALGLTLGATLTWMAITSRAVSPGFRPGTLPFAAAGLLALSVVPAVYTMARSANDVARLDGLLEQLRVAEARTLAESIHRLNPQAMRQGLHVGELSKELAKAVRQLENAVAFPLHRDSTAQDRIERARVLAMLDRTAEALDVLAPVDGPQADGLRGTIHEVRGEWQESIAFREKAREAWASAPASAEQKAGLQRAVRGVAYCHRKLGHYTQAEATYRELIALTPNAETHFLLAQFYDDAQNAGQARVHALQAMALDPLRYRIKGEELIRKLSAYHFGCLGVFSAEWGTR